MITSLSLLSFFLLAASVITFAGCALGSSNHPTIWIEDSLVKVFRDAEPGGGGGTASAPVSQPATRPADDLVHAARGEYVSFQVVIRSNLPIQSLTAEAGPFLSQDRKTRIPAACRFVGYVPVKRNVANLGPTNRTRNAPADFPDPLLEKPNIDVPANQAQPVWITVKVPSDAPPGLYAATVNLAGRQKQTRFLEHRDIRMMVHNVTVPDERHLWVTQWFSPDSLLKQCKPRAELFSPEYWALVRKMARNMAEHRQNVAIISPLGQAIFKAGGDGRWQIDFSRFDKFVEIFIEEGVIGRIEGGHIGGRKGGWKSGFNVEIRTVENGKVVGKRVTPDSAEADRFYAQFLPALVSHLKEKGWLSRYIQHVADEPTSLNSDSYLQAVRLVRKYAPGVKTIEACHTSNDLVGAVDIWVPQLNYYDPKFHPQRQQMGDEVWFYTCLYPEDDFCNRFIEQPLVKTRLVHWLNFKLGATGYLHWGYNYWMTDDPFKDTEPVHGEDAYLPAGDAWIVYPSADGVIDSIRHEAMRDGIEDYELLLMLAKKDAKAAADLINDPDLKLRQDYSSSDVKVFNRVHLRLLELLSK